MTGEQKVTATEVRISRDGMFYSLAFRIGGNDLAAAKRATSFAKLRAYAKDVFGIELPKKTQLAFKGFTYLTKEMVKAKKESATYVLPVPAEVDAKDLWIYSLTGRM